MTDPPRQPLISIVMPMYNGEAFVDAAVESVLAQTYTHWELAIVDDGSRDQGPARARAWADRDERIRVLQHPGGANRGVSETRNVGLRDSSGSWIALLDCDDVWLPHKLERQVAIVEREPGLSLVYSQAQVIDDEGRIVTETRPGMRKQPIFGEGVPGRPMHDYAGFLAGRYWPPASSALFSREAAAACGGFEPLPFQVEDTLLFLRLSTVGAMWFSDEVLAHYRIHGNQWNSTITPSRKAAARFCYLKRLTDTVDSALRQVTAEALVDRGVRPLARALISGYEVRPGQLIGFLGQVLRDPRVPTRQKWRAARIVGARLLLTPWQVLRRLFGRGGRGGTPKVSSSAVG